MWLSGAGGGVIHHRRQESVAAVVPMRGPVISTVVMVVVIVVIVIGQGVAEQTCGGNAGGGRSRVHRLNRIAVGVVGCHATDASTDGGDEDGETSLVEDSGDEVFGIHTGVDAPGRELFKRILWLWWWRPFWQVGVGNRIRFCPPWDRRSGGRRISVWSGWKRSP
jgi:hypothetical protein